MTIIKSTFGFLMLAICLPRPAIGADRAHTWLSIGPNAINGLNYGLASGRVTDIAAGDDGTIMLASANGGIWKRGAHDAAWLESNGHDQKRLPTLAFGSLDRRGEVVYGATGVTPQKLDTE
jgi:hypothetical protein